VVMAVEAVARPATPSAAPVGNQLVTEAEAPSASVSRSRLADWCGS
jgi:hypothetical protein